VLYLTSWNQAQQSLRQERNLLLVERLRSLGPAGASAPAYVPPGENVATPYIDFVPKNLPPAG